MCSQTFGPSGIWTSKYIKIFHKNKNPYVWVVFAVFPLQEGAIEAEEFTSRLYKELNSSPQPYLVPFLKVKLFFFLVLKKCSSIHVIQFYCIVVFQVHEPCNYLLLDRQLS